MSPKHLSHIGTTDALPNVDVRSSTTDSHFAVGLGKTLVGVLALLVSCSLHSDQPAPMESDSVTEDTPTWSFTGRVVGFEEAQGRIALRLDAPDMQREFELSLELATSSGFGPHHLLEHYEDGVLLTVEYVDVQGTFVVLRIFD